MADIPEHELEETRAALAPTLEATAAILPWVSKPKKARFDANLNVRWIAAGKRLAAAWSRRHDSAPDDVRPAIFNLYAVAIETADADCLSLGEALAGAADRLEETTASPRLIAAITACIECLDDAAGLEHPSFSERSGHFARRLEATATATNHNERSAVLDRLFISEASDQIQMMQDALAVLPPDAYALTTEGLKLAEQAELLELWGVMHMARRICKISSQEASHLDDPATRADIHQMLADLSSAIASLQP